MTDQDEIKSMKMQGVALVQDNRLQEAMKLFSHIVERDANDAEAWLTLCNLNARLGNLNEAGDCCRRVIHLQPDSWEAYLNLGNILRLEEKHEQAITQYIYALRINPDFPPVLAALSNLGKVLLRDGKNDLASVCFQQVVDLKTDFSDSAIIIYAPGKVGSTTILASLEYFLNLMPSKVPIYHAHHLNDFDRLEANIKSRFTNPKMPLQKLAAEKDVRRIIDSDTAQRWYVISLTRDPVARAMSLIFQMLDDYFPGWRTKYKEGRLDLSKIQAEMMKLYSDPSNWFDIQLKPVFDIDVYSHPFPHQQGYEIYKGKNNSRLLLIRLEDLNLVGKQAIKNFLNIRHFDFIQSNTGDKKEYASLYREFKKLSLPVSFLERLYTSRYARHFYTDQEINGFYRKWIGG